MPTTPLSPFVTIQLVEADESGVAWDVTARTLLKLDPEADPDESRRIYDACLAEARLWWRGQS